MSISFFKNFLLNLPKVYCKIDEDGKESSINYVCSLPNISRDEIAENIRLQEGYKKWDVKTKHIDGVYIEVDECTFLVYQPNSENAKIDSDNYDQSIDASLSEELTEFGRENQIENLISINLGCFVALLVTYSEALRQIFSLDIKDLEEIKSLNSHKTLIKYHKLLSNQQIFSSNSHLRAFAWIYFIELKIISEIYSNRKDLDFHDVATNTGHFPLLINSLTELELFGVQFNSITCSDLDVDLAQDKINKVAALSKTDHSNIQVLKVDLLKDTSSLKKADIITANDVLEHFHEDASFDVLQRLWRSTKKLLLVHVPVEETPNKTYGHYTAFSAEKLKNWAGQLPDCINITSRYQDLISICDDASNRDGFLCLLRDVQSE